MRIFFCYLIFTGVIQARYVPGTSGADWNQEEVIVVKAKIRKAFTTGWADLSKKALSAIGLPAEELKNENVYHHSKGFNAQKALRLSFHDCVKYVDGSGGELNKFFIFHYFSDVLRLRWLSGLGGYGGQT